MKRMILAIVLSILASVAMVSAQSGPDIRISQISQIPDPVEPGDYVDLRFRVDNLGAPASSFEYELVTNYPFTLDPDVPRRVSVGTSDSYRAAADQGATLYWRVRVASDAVPGDRNTVTIRFYPRSGDDQTYVTREFPVRVGAREGLLVVRDARIEPSDVAPGSRFEVFLDIENLGTAELRNVRVTSEVEGTPFSPFGSANGKLVRTIDAGEAATVGFEFFSDPSVSLGVERLPFTIAFSDSTGVQYSLPATVGVPIDESPSLLANLESSNVHVREQRGEIVLSVSNTGSSPLNFVVLSLEESDGYEIVGSRRTYLGNLLSDDFETGQFRIYTSDDAQMPLPLEFTITYRTAYGEQMTETVVMDLPLYSRERARELGLIEGSAISGTLVFVLVVIAGVVGYVWWNRRRKSR